MCNDCSYEAVRLLSFYFFGLTDNKPWNKRSYGSELWQVGVDLWFMVWFIVLNATFNNISVL